MAWRESIFGATLLLAGCGVTRDPIPEATPEMALEMGVEQAQLVRGRDLYLANCARCHERVLPGNIDPEYWRGIMPHMGKNADLSKSQETDVLIYLMAAHGTVHGLNLEH
jgi:cytochrome c5